MERFIDVKAGDVLPWTDYCVGQAAAYCVRLLELSATNRRYSASCLVTKLHEAVVVNVERGKGGTWIYRRAILSARAAIFRMFNAPLSEHGIMGRNNPVVINNQEIHLTEYLGSGASGIVYETTQKYAVKFFLDSSSDLDLKSKEKLIVDKLNANKPNSVLLQQVIDSDDEIVWPALLLYPVGVSLSPISNISFKRADSFFSILETLKYAHSQGIIHNDIRPDNIVVVEGNKWLLFDWAAAWEINSTEETKKREYYGCVSYASDSALTQLQLCHDLVQEDDKSYPYMIDAPSILSDLISLFRTVYVFAFRISDRELNELMNLRAKFAFIDIITWWKVHLSEHAQDTETKLINAFEKDPHNIHDTAASLARTLFPQIN